MLNALINKAIATAAIEIPETTGSLDNLLTAFEWVGSRMGSVATLILSQPIFLIPLGISYLGASIGLCGRLMGN